jgi:hypothetical protein
MNKTEKAIKHVPMLRFTTRAVAIGDAMLEQPVTLDYAGPRQGAVYVVP